MKRTFVLLALCASVAVPVAAVGQPGRAAATRSAMMEKMRADAKAAAYAALTPGARDRGHGIVAQVTAGSSTRVPPAGQIDALLTPDEQKAILAAADKSRRAMRDRNGGRRWASAARSRSAAPEAGGSDGFTGRPLPADGLVIARTDAFADATGPE